MKRSRVGGLDCSKYGVAQPSLAVQLPRRGPKGRHDGGVRCFGSSAPSTARSVRRGTRPGYRPGIAQVDTHRWAQPPEGLTIISGGAVIKVKVASGSEHLATYTPSYSVLMVPIKFDHPSLLSGRQPYRIRHVKKRAFSCPRRILAVKRTTNGTGTSSASTLRQAA